MFYLYSYSLIHLFTFSSDIFNSILIQYQCRIYPLLFVMCTGWEQILKNVWMCYIYWDPFFYVVLCVVLYISAKQWHYKFNFHQCSLYWNQKVKVCILHFAILLVIETIRSRWVGKLIMQETVENWIMFPCSAGWLRQDLKCWLKERSTQIFWHSKGGYSLSWTMTPLFY